MQITINTDTDDLPAVIRMLQALTGESPTGRLHKLMDNVAEPALQTGPVVEIPGTPADQIYTGAALQAAVLPPCSAHAQEDDEQVFAAPKSLFDSVPDVAAAGRAMAAELAKGPSVTVSDVTVDAAGLPWDARIHSGAKTKLANGNWKLLRGVDPALVASVEAELRGAPAPAPAVSPPPPPASIAATPYAPPPAPPAPKPITNAAELVNAVVAERRFTIDQVNAACQKVGIDNVASLLAKQDKLPDVLRQLGVSA